MKKKHKQDRKVSYGTAVRMAILAAVFTGTLTLSVCLTIMHIQNRDAIRLGEKYERLNELDYVVSEKYYKDAPEEDVIDSMLAGYVDGLGDKYSVYRSEKELSAYQNQNAGIYIGIGITVQKQEDGTVEIISVTEDGSAEKAGIEAGDLLLEVEGISAEEHYTEAIEAVSGEPDTDVVLRIRRHDSGIEQTLTVKRMKLDEDTVSYEMLEDHIGYIRITKFRTVTAEQFEEARQALLQDGAEAFIFDVRNNGGGVLSALEQMVDPMLPEGDLAFAYDKEGNATTILHSDKEFEQMPYIILVNGGTASASELFACVLRDYADAVLVGEQTFGKGIMQTTFELSGGGVTLTTATYATGKTPCYHEVGLTPDIPSELAEDAETDTQLEDALSAAREKIAAKDAA